MDFIASHLNITGGVAFHTWSGVLLRPYGDHADEAFAAEDLWTYQAIAQKGTGYRLPAISSFREFRYHPQQVTTGVFDDWLYGSRGVFGWTVELLEPQREAGIDGYRFIEWDREHAVEDESEAAPVERPDAWRPGLCRWYPFEHPQLGPVELGGWD